MKTKNYTASRGALAFTLTLLLASAALHLAATAGEAENSQKVKMTSMLSASKLQTGKPQSLYLKVSLTGFKQEAETHRTPVNVALVLDKSGSMTGEKLAKAKEAAIQALSRLRADDIVSVIAYDTTVSVVVPATKMSNRDRIIDQINSIEAEGNTALFAGVSKGAAEVRKFFDNSRYNHIILLSDGLANVGPSTPAELGDLGASLIKEGISVSTLGLGLDYNEDLMAQLSRKSDGNHYFAETADDLERIFNRAFGGTLAVVAQDVEIAIDCEPGMRPVRVLGREAMIDGQRVALKLNQIYSEHEKYVLLEIEAPSGEDKASRKVATVSVNYLNLMTQEKDSMRQELSVSYTADEELALASEDREVMIAVVEQISAEKNLLAMTLRDKGEVEKARELLSSNSAYLLFNAGRYNSEKLRSIGYDNQSDAENLDPAKYRERRKVIQQRNMQQQMQTF
ncbi:VWA domain-containing protein [Candidatus Sumerlaeota bacterium]|nr:VWA domain-containing protein [Candidatus Sumerlaeota bacterium]